MKYIVLEHIKGDMMEQRRVIDLSGPEGNAFALLGMAKTWGRQIGLDTDSIINDMTSSDYDHLLEVFEKWFGAVAVLQNKPCDRVEDDEDEWD